MKGGKTLMINLGKEIKEIRSGALKGVKAGSIFLEGESLRVVPHDTGTLANTSFNKAQMQGNTAVGTTGYTAEYAPFVHEMPASYNYSKPNTGPKYLERPLKDNRNRILAIIKKRVEI